MYVGNDLNDLAVMKLVGTAVAPKNSHPAVLKIASIILGKNGGDGAVRELIEDRLGIMTY
jgi:N-acylneuraminate cytidylyltransferase